MRAGRANSMRRLWRHLSRQRRRQLGLVLVLMIISSFTEVFTIGAVVPFLSALASPERLFAEPAAQPLIRALGIAAPAQLLLPVTLVFALGALSAGAMRLAVLWTMSRASFAAGADISIEVYRRTLLQPYAVHLSRNSAEVIGGIVHKAVAVIVGTLIPALTIFGSSIVALAVISALVAIEPLTAALALLGFGSLYAIIMLLVRNRLELSGELVARQQVQVVKCLQEGLGAIRDVLIDGSQAAYVEIYRQADALSRRGQATITFVSNSPRAAVEALGMVLIAGLAFNLSRASGGLATSIPVLGALALGAQALMPALQSIYLSWSTIKAHDGALREALELLDQPLPSWAALPQPRPIAFDHSIDLEDVGFRYSPGGPWVLRHVDLHVPRGTRVGIQGVSGGGKSTLLDILMGLLDPVEGRLRIDGRPVTDETRRAWQVRLAHVPQSIFLADSSIAENIALGAPGGKVDLDRVRAAARQAQLLDFVDGLPNGFRSRVGERGVHLSGGQRQRIGIARALYKRASVIVFDESTSALDSETERAVMTSIFGLGRDLTLFIVAHRLSTLEGCDWIVEVDGRGIRRHVVTPGGT